MNASSELVHAEVANSKAWHKSIVDIVTRIDGKQKVMGSTPVYLPSLDMVADGMPAPDKIETDEDGKVSIIYNDEALQYVQSALTQKVEGVVRSAIQWNKQTESGTPEYTGQSREAAQDFDSLLESANTGLYFAVKKEWLTKFKAWLAASALPQAGQDQLYSMILLEKGLSSQPANVREAIGKHVLSFVSSLGDDASEVSAYTNKVVSYLESGIEDAGEFAFL